MSQARATTYLALIGDIADSRTLRPRRREALQRELQDWIEELNDELKGRELAAPLTLTAGDEIQGLFRRPFGVVRVIQELTDRLLASEGQTRIVFGAGCGSLTTGRVPAPPLWAPNPALLDGPAFHHAKSALMKARKDADWVRFSGFARDKEPRLDLVLDGLFGLMGTIRWQWTTNQATISRGHRSAASQRHLASALDVSPSVVSETLKAARHRQLEKGEEAALILLEARLGK